MKLRTPRAPLLLPLLLALAPSAASAAPPVFGAPASAARLVARDQRWQRQRAYPAADLPAGAYSRAIAAWSALPRMRPSAVAIAPALAPAPPGPPPDPKDAVWKFLGPAPLDVTTGPYPTPNMGPTAGRAAAVAIDPKNPDVIYAGYAMGGVWKSLDKGLTWAPLMDGEASLAVGSIAVDPTTTSTIWVGTGEPALYAGYGGRGVLKSIDAGKTWAKVGGDAFDGLSIAKIVLDGPDLYLSAAFGDAGRGETCNNVYADAPGQGVYKSTDGGATWKKLRDGSMTDLEVDTSVSPRRMFVSDYLTGVWRSIDGGATWEAPAGLPTAQSAPKARRPELALTAADPTVVYVGISVGGAAHVYLSKDAGATFAEIAGAPNYCEAQCYYDNAVVADPVAPGTVYVGGSLCGVWRSTDALSAAPTWTNVSAHNGDCGLGDADWYLGDVHPDVHALTLDPSDPKTIYASTDGGIARSTDSGGTWERVNDGVGTVQLYSVCVDPIDPEILYGGAQDNGSLRRPSATTKWLGISSGDGGPCAVNPTNPKSVIVSGEGGSLLHSKDGFAKNATDVFETDPAYCKGGAFPGCGDRTGFIAPLVADPTAAGTFYVGTYRLWKATDGGTIKGWKPISPDLTAGPGGSVCVPKNFPAFDDVLDTITVAPSDSNTIYTGSEAGQIWRTTDGGTTWTKVSKDPLPGRWVAGIAVDPLDPKTVFAAFSGFDATTPNAPGHLFTSTDGGETWTKLVTPDAPIDALIAHPVAQGLLYAGTDLGAMVSNDAGQTWGVLGDSLPNVAVYSLAFQRKSGRLVAGTHGRSAWAMDFTAGALGVSPATLTFTAPLGGAPADQALGVTNGDVYGSTIDFTAAADSPWLTVTPASSSAAGAHGATLTVHVAASALKLGAVDGAILITPTGGVAAIKVPVHVSILEGGSGGGGSGSGGSGGGSAKGGCGCRVGGADADPGAALAALAVGGMILARRRRRAAR